MKLIKTSVFVATLLAVFALGALAQDSPQSRAASKKAKFDTIATTDDAIKKALDAHDLQAAAKLVGRNGSFTGTVTKIFSPRSGTIVILNFDRDYKTALTAVVKRDDFGRFPDLTALEGKQVLVTGKFVDFKGATEIDLSKLDQIKIVEGSPKDDR